MYKLVYWGRKDEIKLLKISFARGELQYQIPSCVPRFEYALILGDPAADSEGEGKSKRAGKYGTKKSKERPEEPLGTMSYQTSSKRSPPIWLLIGQKNTKVF